MQSRSFNWLALVLLTAIVGLSFWLLRMAEDDGKPPTRPTQGVDFWVEQFTVRGFGQDGQLQHVLTAARLAHDSTDDSSVLTQPHITYVRAPQLVIMANQGLVAPQGKSIDFIGNVQIDRAPQKKVRRNDKGQVRIRTERMTVFPDREIAEGNVPVRIEQMNSVATGGSFKSDSKTGVSILEGKVRATILRNNS